MEQSQSNQQIKKGKYTALTSMSVVSVSQAWYLFLTDGDISISIALSADSLSRTMKTSGGASSTHACVRLERSRCIFVYLLYPSGQTKQRKQEPAVTTIEKEKQGREGKSYPYMWLHLRKRIVAAGPVCLIDDDRAIG